MKIELGKKQNQKLYNVVDPPSIANNPVSATFLSLNPFFKQVYFISSSLSVKATPILPAKWS